MKIRLVKNYCAQALSLMLAISNAAEAFGQNPVNAPAIATAEEHALSQLVSILQQTNTLDAEVEQLVIGEDGRELEESRVKLLMQKPANFRWEVIEPFNELMITDGSLIWHYEPDLEQVTIKTFDAELDRTPVMLLNGTAQSIGESYAVSAATMTDGARTRFILQPKRPESQFERMSLTFKGPDLEEMQFEDSRGARTSLTFRQVRRNQTIDAGQFHYTPAEGVEVIDSTLE